ncbi:MAG: extensin family protein [Casimicrobiaceae bacterium]
MRLQLFLPQSACDRRRTQLSRVSCSAVSHWRGNGSDAQFLRDIHRGACRHFDAALGPDYNNAHHDHLHFDRGSYRVCP